MLQATAGMDPPSIGAKVKGSVVGWTGERSGSGRCEDQVQ